MVPGRQRMKVRQWPLLGVLLVVSFLGHDLLMAGEAAGRTATARPALRITDLERMLPGVTRTRRRPTNRRPSIPRTAALGSLAVPRSDDAFDRADQELATAASVVG